MNNSRIYLKLENLTKRYGNLRAVDRVSLDIYNDEFVTLLGASGSGKTTTLMMIAGFTMPDEGTIFLNGINITYTPSYQRNIGVVFQNYALFPHMNIYENIGYPLRVRKVSEKEIRSPVEEMLGLVKLEGYGDRYPHELSGGQQQRVALARALVFQPRLLLMDEPLGALDKKLREYMQLEIKHIQEKLKITVVYVTHDQGEGLTMSNRIAIIEKGRIEQVGSPHEVYRKPSNRFVADFIGESNFLDGIVVRFSGEHHASAKIAGGQEEVHFIASRPIAQGETVTLMIRPEAISIVGEDRINENQLNGVVKEVIFMGEYIVYQVVLSQGQTIRVKQPTFHGVPEYRPGDRLFLGWQVRDTNLL